MRTRERAALLSQQWTDLDLRGDEVVTMYDCYPYLFADAFPAVQVGDLADLSLAIKLLASSVFLADKIMDLKPRSYDAPATLSHVFALQVEAYTVFRRLFPPDSAFWPHFQACFDRYLYTCRAEKTFALGQSSWKEFDEATALETAVGKANLSHCVIAGLAALQGDEGRLKKLCEALDLYNFAYQMFDDLCDWKEDYLQQSPSLLLCRWLPQRPDNPQAADIEALARELYYDGHACAILQLASDTLERVLQMTADMPELAWRIVPRNLYERCESLCRDILKITELNRRRLQQHVSFSLELPVARTPYEQLTWRALQFLILQWQRGFGELRDIARFAHNNGFSAESEFQYGDVFQRAVVADCVQAVANAFGLDLGVFLDYETRYILEQRCQDGIGGWSYYPDLPEIPPDADDLAQVMQLLLHRGRRAEIVHWCEQPLATLLNENRHADGSFETWIIPHQRTPKQERQLAYCQKVWGTGADVDVMANLLYALALYDPDRFAEVIAAGASYIEGQQQAEGSWLSTWYHGPYYGTYVCTRLLAQVKPESPALPRASAFLATSQLADGSWTGNVGAGDALNTALALLGCLGLARAGVEQSVPSAIDRALAFLQQNYDEETGAWPACDFIRMAEGRLSGVITRVVSYGSHCITTAFVLKALAFYHRYRNQGEVEA